MRGEPFAASNKITWLRLLGCNVAGRLGQALDPVLDVSERLKAGLDCGRWNILQHIDGDGVAQTVEIVDKLAAARGEKQTVGPAIPGVMTPLEQTVFDQPIEQAHQRDWLQFKHVSQIDLRQPFLLPQPEQYDPLRTRSATPLGAVLDIVTQQPGAFDKLRNQLAFQVEGHGCGGLPSFPIV
jgi:hypothetical protein